jgi:hypothetical protein
MSAKDFLLLEQQVVNSLAVIEATAFNRHAEVVE